MSHGHSLRRFALPLALPFALAAYGCARDPLAAETVPAPLIDLPSPPRSLPPAADGALATAVVAMGCFWCAEGVFEQIEGVTDVVSGYAGGTRDTASYEQVGGGSTAHAEAVKITYDPRRVSYGKLLQVFFTTHDPTTRDRQGPDWGRQYRSALFIQGSEQRAVAAAYMKQLAGARTFSAPIVTTLEALTEFYPAEAYHQDYVRRHPDHPYVRAWFPAKEKKLRDHLAPLLKARPPR